MNDEWVRRHVPRCGALPGVVTAAVYDERT